MTMFIWDNGEIWVHSVAHRPALDVVSAALFTLGIVLMLVRYLRQRNWLDLFLLLSVPLLMLPSILSLAFPAENPSLNRMAGAIIPVFLVIAIALDAMLGIIESGLGHKLGKGIAWALVLFLLVLSAYQNYDLVFNQYQTSYKSTSWNTSEMGQVIRDFTNLVGDPDSAYVVAYPHWVDTRLVGINAGYPLKDYAIWPDSFKNTLSNQQAKLFLIKIEDIENIDALRELYPQGVLQKYVSQVESHNFFIFFVPPQG
jgi:NADH:ubiquinone oxidoreductase subunit K